MEKDGIDEKNERIALIAIVAHQRRMPLKDVNMDGLFDDDREKVKQIHDAFSSFRKKIAEKMGLSEL